MPPPVLRALQELRRRNLEQNAFEEDEEEEEEEEDEEVEDISRFPILAQAISRKSALVCVTFFFFSETASCCRTWLSTAHLEPPCEGGSDGYASS